MAQAKSIQLYATGSATANAVAQITIPSATTLRQCNLSAMADAVTDNAAVRLQFSKVPTSQIAVNGALDPFLEIAVYGNFATSGLSLFGVNQFYPLAVHCRQGEIVYVHATVAGTITYFVNAIFFY
jgi:hypothetical protein